jgi:hypothetical protein
MTTRLSPCVDGRPRLGERGGQIGRGVMPRLGEREGQIGRGVMPRLGEREGQIGRRAMNRRDTQRLSPCVDGRPRLGERGGHFQAPA